MEVFIGTIQPFAFNFAPRGWALCNGQIMPIAQNTAMFSLLGTTFGGGPMACAAIEAGRDLAVASKEILVMAGEVVDEPWAEFDTADLQFEVAGQTWPFFDKALILLNKPAGYECSQKPKHHPAVFSLLPPSLVATLAGLAAVVVACGSLSRGPYLAARWPSACSSMK